MSELQLTVVTLLTFAGLAFVIAFGAAFGIYCAKKIGESLSRIGKGVRGLVAVQTPFTYTGFDNNHHEVHEPVREKNMESDEDNDKTTVNTETIDA